MLEREMREPVHAWLNRDAPTDVIYEFLMAGYCDMVGIQFADRVGRAIPQVVLATAVELKLTDIAGVLRQAQGNRHFVHESFAAMPAERCGRMQPRTLDRFVAAHVGLLSVGNAVEIIIPAGKPWPTLNIEYWRKRWWKRILRSRRWRITDGKI